jgi:dynein heavy chain 2, cytosolic
MLPACRLEFANQLLSWANEPSLDPKSTCDFFVNQRSGLEKYLLHVPEEPIAFEQMQDLDCIPVVETADMKRSIDVITPWLNGGHPFLVVGPEGSGKATLLRHCFSLQKSTSVATIHCNAQTNSKNILHKLYQCCLCATTSSGRVLRPKDADKLILYVKDINLPKADKVYSP